MQNENDSIDINTVQDQCNSEVLELQSNLQGGQGGNRRNPNNESTNSNGLRKRIEYNDSSLNKGGGGTGLLSRTSDKSSSSSKNFNKKSNTSSNSSGMKDMHLVNQSENSSSEKSDQRYIDRLMKRNDIHEIYEANSDPIDSNSGNEPNDSKSTHIQFLSLT